MLINHDTEIELPLSPGSLRATVTELGILFRENRGPSDCINGFLEVLNQINKCAVMKMPFDPTMVAGDIDSLFQPTDLLRCYLSAVRARDWPQVSIIEQEICSL